MAVAADIVFKYFPLLSSEQKEQLEALGPLYAEWNEKINVISRKDIEELYTRHVLHSLAIARFATFESGSHILDVGTGGGFPGIPLAILFPQSTFVLVDSIGKKIKVVQEVAKAIGLENVTAHHLRAEQLKEKFDFVISRAVAPTKTILQWTGMMVRPGDHATLANGLILLKGGDLDEELKAIRRPHMVTAISDYFTEEFFETKKVVYVPM